MRWSIPIGRVFGITLRLHVTFLIFLAFIGYTGFLTGGWESAGWLIAMFVSIFACIALHELGHSVVAQQLGVEVKSITLLPIGGVAALRSLPENPWHEIAITLAGPMVNAAIACVLLPFTGLPGHLWLLQPPHDVHGLLLTLAQANITLFLFNFIPAFPMDGGRLLRAMLALVLPYGRATTIAATVGQGLAIVFILVGLNSSIWFVIIGVFIFMGAEGEERLVRMRGFLRDIEVGEVMSRDFAVLSPHDRVSRALQLIYQTGQDDFPVMQDDRLVGLVTRPGLVAAINAGESELPVSEIMDVEVPVVSPRDGAFRVYEEILGNGSSSVAVLEQGHLTGLLTPENISRYLLLQSSLKSGRRRAFGRTPARPPVIAGVPPIVAPPPREESAPPSARA